jgi:hypothetical protein
VRCGTAVIGIHQPRLPPISVPTARPMMMPSYVTMWWWKSVPTTASSMPNSARNMPRRAYFGELSPFRPRMKQIAERI